MNSQGRFLRY